MPTLPHSQKTTQDTSDHTSLLPESSDLGSEDDFSDSVIDGNRLNPIKNMDCAEKTTEIASETMSPAAVATLNGITTDTTVANMENPDKTKARTLLGVTNIVNAITNTGNQDHAYYRQPVQNKDTPAADYAATEDEDNAIDALLQLSENQGLNKTFQGDNSSILSIGIYLISCSNSFKQL